MNDGVIIQSEQYNVKKSRNIIFIVSAVLVVVGLLLYAINFNECREVGYSYVFDGPYHRSLWTTMMNPFNHANGFLIDLGIILFVIMAIIGWWLSSYQLVVTDKRIYGKTSWGKRVDLPVDSISAVSSSTLKGIAISTASGRIVFKCIKNRDAIYETVNGLLVFRQKSDGNVEVPDTNKDSLDELTKLKKLLDNDVITQEEFDIKKKQILGL